MPALLPGLFSRLTHGVYVIGVADGERHNAFTAAWVMQVSFDPPMLALSINPAHFSYRLLQSGQGFSVNVLSRDRVDLARHFGQPASVDKLAHVGWRRTGTGMPRLDDALAWFDCRVKAALPAGDHIVVTGVVVDGACADEAAEPLNYRDTGALDGSAALYPNQFPDG